MTSSLLTFRRLESQVRIRQRFAHLQTRKRPAGRLGRAPPADRPRPARGPRLPGTYWLSFSVAMIFACRSLSFSSSVHRRLDTAWRRPTAALECHSDAEKEQRQGRASQPRSPGSELPTAPHHTPVPFRLSW